MCRRQCEGCSVVTDDERPEPEWMETFTDSVQCDIEVEPESVCQWFFDADAKLWVVEVFAALVEIDGQACHQPLEADVLSLAELFDEAPCVVASPRGLTLDGRYQGEAVLLRVLFVPPADVMPELWMDPKTRAIHDIAMKPPIPPELLN